MTCSRVNSPGISCNGTGRAVLHETVSIVASNAMQCHNRYMSSAQFNQLIGSFSCNCVSYHFVNCPSFCVAMEIHCLVHRTRLSNIHRRGPSLSGCRCSHLEQFTPVRHFCTFVACLPVTPQDSSLHHFLSQSMTMYYARAVTFVILGILIGHVTYLLTCSIHLY